jgi:transcriptional regulator with XRE-family HTH domain
VTNRLIGELVERRRTMNVSQRALAREVGCSASVLWRLEHGVAIDRISLVQIAQIASLLGLELGAALYPLGDPIRDAGHQALIKRFRALLASTIQVRAEAPFPNFGDRRSWDLFLHVESQRIGVEAETRIRDEQLLVRRMRERDAYGGTDEVLLVLSESAVNRRLLPDLLEALGPRFATAPRALLGALRMGKPIPGSGVVLV